MDMTSETVTGAPGAQSGIICRHYLQEFFYVNIEAKSIETSYSGIVEVAYQEYDMD